MKQDLKKLLNEIEIPEPDETARKKTIAAAVAEFKKQNAMAEKKIKGFEKKRRLIDNFHSFNNFIGEIIMKKPLLITGGVTICLAFLIVGVTYNSMFDQNLSNETAFLKKEIKQNSVMVTEDQKGSFKSSSELEVTMSKDDSEAEPSTSQPVIVEKKLSQPAGSGQRPSSPASKPKMAESRLLAKVDGSVNSGPMSMNRPSSQAFDNKTQGTQREPFAVQPAETGRDKFEKITPNPIKLTSKEPVSTFSVDVDTASYAFVRKQLNNGVLPQKNAVRVEELINYFTYNYSLPDDKNQPFKPTVAVYQTPWNPDTKLLHIGIKGYDIDPGKKPRSNLVFLLDVSGSMESPDKLPLLRNSFRMLVDSLSPDDTVAIVVYAGAAGTVLEPTKASEKQKILSSLEQLTAGGSTAGGEGIRQAYALAESNFDKEGVNRVILATDGDFNVGIRNTEELKSFIERKRETGIYLSILGFGQGNYNDALMQTLAQNGNGNAAYIDSLNEARKVLVQEASSTLFTIAKDVKIQIEFNPAMVAEYRLIGYETRMLKREDFNNDKVDAGEIGSGHSVTAIYEITPPESK
ncbi:VWA domain-containing protein, partial [bacterium]|nr:VWA domain-containing protein [bacterium]